SFGLGAQTLGLLGLGEALYALLLGLEPGLLGVAAARFHEHAIVLVIERLETVFLIGGLRRRIGDVDAALGHVEPVRAHLLAAAVVRERLHGLLGERAFGGREVPQHRIGLELVQARAQALVVEIVLGRVRGGYGARGKQAECYPMCRARHGWLVSVAVAGLFARSWRSCAFSRVRASTFSRALPSRALTAASSLFTRASSANCCAAA